MDPIGRLTNYTPGTVSQELKPDAAPAQETPQPVTNTGVAKTLDGFETAAPATNLFGVLEQAVPTSEANQLVIPPDPTIDASDLFTYVTVPPLEVAPPPPPEPPEQLFVAENEPAPESALGKTLEGEAEKGIKNFFKKKTTKEYGPDSDRTTSSKTQNYGSDVGMPANISGLGNGGGKTIEGLEGSWSLVEFGKIDEKTQGEYGNAYVKGSTQVLGLSGQVYYNVDADFEKLTFTAGAGAKGSVEIIGAHYEAGYDTPDLEIGESKVDLNAKTNADAYVGVKGNIQANISLGKNNNLSVGAGAFDGANASLSGKIGAGEIADTHGYLAAWAGVGAKAKFEAGFKDGKLTVDWGLGLALGAGAEWDLGVSIDFGKAVDTALDGMREIGLKEPADWIENTGGDVIEFAGDAAKWAGGAIEDTGKAIGEAAEDTATAIGDAADWTKEAAEAAAKKAQEAAEAAAKAAEAAAKAAEDAAEAAAQAAEDALAAAEEAAEDIVDTAEDVVEEVVEFFEDLW